MLHLRSHQGVALDNTVKTIDFASFDALEVSEQAELRRQIIIDALDGKITILKNVDLGADLDAFEMSEMFPSSLCKIGIEAGDWEVESEFHQSLPFRLVYPGAAKLEQPFLNHADLTTVCERSFGGDWERLRTFISNCEKASGRLRELASSILADHDYYADCPVMRFSLPCSHPMHIDPLPNWERKESIRFFANVDKRPRIWRYSVNIYDFIEREYHTLELGKCLQSDKRDRLERLAKKISRSAQFQESPTRTLELQPNDVWVFDGRLIAHEVVEGRRALSLTTKLRKDRLPDYHVPLDERVFSIHERKRREVQSRFPFAKPVLQSPSEAA